MLPVMNTSSKASRSGALLAFALRDPGPDEFLDECSRKRFVRGELDGSFGCGEALKFVLEGFDHGGSREQTAMARKRGEPPQHSIGLERRHPVTDYLAGR